MICRTTVVGVPPPLTAAGVPRVATLSDTASTVARCTRDCDGLTGQWHLTPGLGVPDLNSLFPPTVPAGCLSASWGMYLGPGLALDPQGMPVVAVTAHVKGFGGQCGTGSRATTTDGFLYSTP
jgi:hypothetical protein